MLFSCACLGSPSGPDASHITGHGIWCARAYQPINTGQADGVLCGQRLTQLIGTIPCMQGATLYILLTRPTRLGLELSKIAGVEQAPAVCGIGSVGQVPVVQVAVLHQLGRVQDARLAQPGLVCTCCMRMHYLAELHGQC